MTRHIRQNLPHCTLHIGELYSMQTAHQYSQLKKVAIKRTLKIHIGGNVGQLTYPRKNGTLFEYVKMPALNNNNQKPKGYQWKSESLAQP